MSNKLDADNNTTAQPDPTVPHYPNKELIIFSGNDAEIEDFEIEVPFVRTVDNIADFFTKAMKHSKQFFNFRRVIMNERLD